MLDAANLASVLMHIEPRRYKRNVFRCVELSALNSIEPMQPLYDLGASKSGQRFTPLVDRQPYMWRRHRKMLIMS